MAVGDPVNVVTGNFYDVDQDLELPGRGLSLQFIRAYNSLDTQSGPLGSGWTHSYNSTLVALADGSVMVREPLGAQVTFARRPDGSLGAPVGNRDKLLELADGGYELRKPNGLIWTYSPGGRLMQIKDANDNQVTLSYTGGELTKVTAPGGRDIDLVYSAGHLESITDPAGEVVDYDYTDGKLTSVTDRTGAITSYAYDTTGRLTTITAPGTAAKPGATTTVTYGSDGRVSSAGSDNDTGKVTFRYDPENRRTFLTDSKGHKSTFLYDDEGHITKTVDPYGAAVSYRFDVQGRQTKEIDPLGNATSYLYDSADRVTEIRSPQFDDAAGQPQAANLRTFLTYGPLDSVHLTQQVGPGGFAADTLTEHDSDGNPTSVTDAEGNTTSFTVDAHGQVTAVEDGRNNTTETSFNPDGSIEWTEDREGHRTYFTYDAVGRVSKVTDQLGRDTDLEYDEEGRLTKTTYPPATAGVARLSETLTYDPRGNLVEKVDSAGKRWAWGYDRHDRVVREEDPTGRATTYEYDTEGNRTKVTDPAGVVTETVYDKVRRPVQVIRKDGTISPPVTRMSYDDAGNLTSTVDAKGHVTSFTWDSRKRLTKVVDDDGGITQYRWTVGGNLAEVINANGHWTRYSYDKLGHRKTKQIQGLAGTWSYSYDANGNLASRTDPRGKTTTYTRDLENRLTAVSYSDATPDVVYDLDNAGRPETVTDGTGTSTFIYDGLDRVTAEQLPGGQTLGRHYDAAGRQDQISVPGHGATAYEFDDAGRLTAVVDPSQRRTTYTYDAGGRLDKVQYPAGGLETDYGYDSLGRVSSLVNRGTASQILNNLSYSYDAADNVSAITDVGGRSATFAYDGLDRLISESYTGPGVESLTSSTTCPSNTGMVVTAKNRDPQTSQVPQNHKGRIEFCARGSGYEGPTTISVGTLALDGTPERALFTRDVTLKPEGETVLVDHRDIPAGHAIVARVTRPGTTTRVAASYLIGQPSASLGPAPANQSYTYDSAGNRLTKVEDGTTTSYAYDTAEQMTAAGGAALTYDSAGNPSTRTSAGQTTAYTYDAENRLVAEGAKSYGYDASGRRVTETFNNVTTTSTFDGSKVISERQGSTSTFFTVADRVLSRQAGATGSPTYLLGDRLGSIVAQADSAGGGVDRFSYDAFGVLREDAGPSLVHFGYLGNERDPATKTDDFHARSYSAADGRFLGRDPVEGVLTSPQTLNPSAHGYNNPLRTPDAGGDFAPLAIAGVMALGAIESVGIDGSAHYLAHRGDKGGVNWSEFNWQQSAVYGTAGGVLGKVALTGWRRARANAGLIHAGRRLEQAADAAPRPSVDLATSERRRHILDGDPHGPGGGHRPGTGRPNKSEFPADWSDDKIMEEISDIATHPGAWRDAVQQSNGNWKLEGTRDGIDIRVIVKHPQGEDLKIITGFPTNVPRNPPAP